MTTATQVNQEMLNLPAFIRRYGLAALVLFQILVHLPMANQPAQGQHVWRKIVGHAAAMNYFQEDNRFFWPRSDIRLSADDTGAIYHELPLTYWLTGQAYRAFGVSPLWSRLICLCFNLLLIFGAYRLGLALGYLKEQAFLFSFFMSTSPLFIYYADSFLPEILGLSLFLNGIAFLVACLGRDSADEGIDSPKRSIDYRLWVLGLIVTTLATLAKPTYLFFGLPLAYVFMKKRRLLLGGLTALILLGTNGLVLRHAKALYDASPLERQVHTPIGPAERPQSWADLSHNLGVSLGNWFVEMNVGHAALIFFAVGLWLAWKNRGKATLARGFWIAWGVSFAAFASLFVMRFADHDYYITATLPAAALLSAQGAHHLLRSQKGQRFALILLALVPIMSLNRIMGRNNRPQVPAVLLSQEAGSIVEGIPRSDLVLVEGDKTPIVFLYYLQRKGLSFDTRVTPDLDLSAFHWLIHYKSQNPIHPLIKERYNLDLNKEVSDFTVYAMSPKSSSATKAQ